MEKKGSYVGRISNTGTQYVEAPAQKKQGTGGGKVVTGTDLRSFTMPVRPRRCDHLRLRFEGEGKGMVFSLTKTYTHGSDV